MASKINKYALIDPTTTQHAYVVNIISIIKPNKEATLSLLHYYYYLI